MNLKESYRYSNYLANLLSTAYSYLQSRDFVTTTTQNHLRSKTNSEAADDTVVVKKSCDVSFTPNDVINLVVKLIDEKERLAAAIAEAKRHAGIDMDNAAAMNKQKQQFVNVLNTLAGIKPKASTVSGYGYKFNQDGNQVKYCYDIEQETTIDYDRTDVRGLIKKYNKACDAVSAKLDEAMIQTQVVFDAQFDVDDSFEEAIMSLN